MNKELKPVRCGCGGPTKIDYIFIETYSYEHDCPVDEPAYRVYCKQCGISTPCAYPTEAEAVTAWNRAMGATDNNVGEKVKDILERNEQLSWQELKNMKGKKVWIETTKNKRWLLITGFRKHSKYYHMFTTPYVGGEAIYFSNLSRGGSIFYKTNMGKTWNAYRKERK